MEVMVVTGQVYKRESRFSFEPPPACQSKNLMSDQEDFILQPRDVVVVRTYLLHFLPVELANIIIDEARYWPNLVYTFAPPREIPVNAHDYPDNIAAKCCVLSEPLPCDEEYDMSMKIAEVRFLIEAHDQGWCTNLGEYTGPYDQSYTWFEAVIIRDLKVDNEVSVEERERESLIVEALERRRHRSSNENDATGQTMTQTLELSVPRSWFFGFMQKFELAPCTLITVKNVHGGSDVWSIQTNPRAQRHPSRHDIVWGRHDTHEDEEERYRLTGSKLGKGFIPALRPGDRVAVLARAQYPSWTNFVKTVKMEIYFSV